VAINFIIRRSRPTQIIYIGRRNTLTEYTECSIIIHKKITANYRRGMVGKIVKHGCKRGILCIAVGSSA
jgi:hypothetical protein